MPEVWMPGAQRLIPSRRGGTPLGNGGPRAIWHTTESDAGNIAFESNRAWLVQQGTEPHLLWDPTTGRIGQFFPADVSARTLKNNGTQRTNRTGMVTIQIEVLGRAAQSPLKNGSCKGLDKILEWLDSWKIPRAWPAGYPLVSGQVASAYLRPKDVWDVAAGHYGHSHVPGNSHTDPGLIDPTKWFKEEPVMPVDPYTMKKVHTDQVIPLNKWVTLDIGSVDALQPPVGSNDWWFQIHLDFATLTGATRNDLRYIKGRWARHNPTSPDANADGLDTHGSDTKAISADLPRTSWQSSFSTDMKGLRGVPVEAQVYIGSMVEGTVSSPLRIYTVDDENT